MTTIDYYFSLLSPFTYLAGLKLEDIASRRGTVIAYKPVNIGELFAETGGTPPAKRHWSRQEYRLQEMRRLSRGYGMPLNEQPAHWPVDVTLPATVVIAAQDDGQPVGDFVHGVLRGVWAENRDVSNEEAVRGIAASSGIDLAAIESALPAAETRYRENTREAIERGVFGSPFYCVGDERFWGQDRLSWLDDHLGALASS